MLLPQLKWGCFKMSEEVWEEKEEVWEVEEKIEIVAPETTATFEGESAEDLVSKILETAKESGLKRFTVSIRLKDGTDITGASQSDVRENFDQISMVKIDPYAEPK